MGKRYDHRWKNQARNFFGQETVKTIITLLVIELVFLLYVAHKGLGMDYLPVTLMIMGLTCAGCGIAFHFHADRYLVIFLMVLLNIGFVVQEVGSGSGVATGRFLWKFMVAIGAAFLAAFVYRWMALPLSDGRAALAMAGIQLVVCIVMALYGTVVGGSGEQGAAISIGGITPFEIVKILYPFVAAALLCKPADREIRLGQIHISKEWLLVGYTLLLAVFFLLCRELGTLLVIGITGLFQLFIFGENRKLAVGAAAVFLTGFILAWAVSALVFYPMILQGEKTGLPDVINKVVGRFGSALHPEQDILNTGYQGSLSLEALTMGGLLGLESERMRLPLPEAANDFIFANVVQTCGLIIGIMTLVFYFALLKRGFDISRKCRDAYFGGLTVSITILLLAEAVIHFGYNCGLFPITGIPLYFLSQGFMALITGMILAAVLLVISADTAVQRKGA